MLGFLKSLAIFVILSTATLGLTVGYLAHTSPQAQNEQPGAPSCKQVTIYSKTTCGACRIKKRELQQAGIPFVAYETDQNREQNIIMWEKAREAGWDRFGLPVLEVNGKLFRASVSTSELKQNLC